MLSIAGNVYARFSRPARRADHRARYRTAGTRGGGERSLESLLSQDTVHVGVADAFQMFMIAMALVAGFLLSNSFLPEPNRT